MMELER